MFHYVPQDLSGCCVRCGIAVLHLFKKQAAIQMPGKRECCETSSVSANDISLLIMHVQEMHKVVSKDSWKWVAGTGHVTLYFYNSKEISLSGRFVDLRYTTLSIKNVIA